MSTDRSDLLLPGLERCPCCGRGLVYVDGTSDSGGLLNRAREVTDPDHGDVALYRECPSCGARWHLYAPASRSRGLADRYVDAWPAFGSRAPLEAWLPTPMRMFEGRQAFDVVPEGTTDPPPRPTSFALPIYVLTAWNPGGRPATLAQNNAAQRTMNADVAGRGWDARTAAVHAADLRWAEQAIVLRGVDERDVVSLAAEYQQPAFLTWSEAGVAALATDTATALDPVVPVTIHRSAEHGCPMRTINGDLQHGVVCRNPGGPWGSAAIHESARWRHQRDMLLSALGCTVGHGTPASGPGGAAREVSPRTVASRYGPARA